MKTIIKEHAKYWQQNLRITAILLVIWFVVTFVAAWYARELNQITFIGPLGFYIAAQGALLAYVIIVGIYAHYMNRLDKEYGIQEDDDDQRTTHTD